MKIMRFISIMLPCILCLAMSANAAAGKDKDLIAAVVQGDLKKAESLLKAGAKVNTRDPELRNMTLLTIALVRKNPEMAKLLLNHGASPDERIDMDGAYMYPLHASIMRKYHDVLKLLLKKGADVELKDSYGTGALVFAAKENDRKAIKILLKNGAKINTIDDIRGGTALHWAAVLGYNALAKELVKAGIDMNAKARNGKTALDLAKKKNNMELVAYLSKKGAR